LPLCSDGSWREFAPAKLNLYLHITGRRADGYHELDSLIAFADIGDTLTLRPAEGPSLSLGGPFAAGLSSGPDNLALRALLALADAAGHKPDVAIHLEKRLPIASGIGGGSADAAAVLRGLAGLWGLASDDPRPMAVATALGADVPVCLAGRPAVVGGIGEVLKPAPALPAAPVVLVNPGLPLSTPAVFKARSGGFSAPVALLEPLDDVDALAAALALSRNMLTTPATTLVPEINTVVDSLAQQPGCLIARMSGSGATCFGLFADDAQAQAAAARLARAPWWTAVGRLTP